MQNRSIVLLQLAFALGWLPLAFGSQGYSTEFAISEPFGVEWGPDRVAFDVSFPQGAAAADGVSLTDENGKPVACQLMNVQFWPDRRSVRSAKVAFMARLAPNQTRKWTLRTGTARVRQPRTDIRVLERGRVIEMANSMTGIRLAGGRETFARGAPASRIPAPVQGVRLPDGRWIGRGSWQTDILCTGYVATVTDDGPVFARAALRYDFEGGRYYAAVVELNAGQDVAVITEEYNLSLGRTYPMSGVDGMRKGVEYFYAYPQFDTPDRALMWDWWGQTMAILPTPNAYTLSLYDGLEPDSADFYGESRYGNLRQGDGGLSFDRDGRFAYINAFPQWGDEETLYLGLYNSQFPSNQVAVIGLRPSEWLHPDVLPHPVKLLKQYTQTTCLVFERRSSPRDVVMKAPVCLGRRVYGIGGVARTWCRHLLPERQGPRLSETETWGSDLMLRHVRLGRLELDVVRRWILDYHEPSRYPRMYVPEGDRAAYLSRLTRKSRREAEEQLASASGPTEADRKAVAEALEMLRRTTRHFAQCNYGNMDFGINEGLIADAAESALSSPAVTQEEVREIRRHLAAMVYQVFNPDFIPPRTSGFAWGSANMMAQVQCRCCPIVALLPNHPLNAMWSDHLAHVVTLYVESQINDAGATLECPHYGSMAIVMPAHALAALAGCAPVDLSRAEARLRAAARHRLSILLPPDPRGGFRSVVPEGDGYYEGDITFAPLAGFFQNLDRNFAEELVWGVRESNNAIGGHADPSYKLLDPDLPARQPQLSSEYFPGYGIVMRSGFPDPRELYLQIYAGGFSWGHGHNDRGCWVLYAMGAPLMVDFAAMYTPSMREAWLHSGGLTFNHDETIRRSFSDAADGWWRKSPSYRDLAVAPFTVLEQRPDPESEREIDTFGEVTAFRSAPEADYAAMQRRIRYLHRVPYALAEPHGRDIFDDSPHEEVFLTNAIVWTRQYVLVKGGGDEGRQFLVVRDDLEGNTELDANLNLWCLADRLDVEGQTAFWTGQHDVDLFAFVSEPRAFSPATRTLGHDCGFGFSENYRRKFGKPFREEMIMLRVPQKERARGFFVVLAPVRRGEPRPIVEPLADGRAVRVGFKDAFDIVLLQKNAEPVELQGRKMTARAALVRQTAGGQPLFRELDTAP